MHIYIYMFTNVDLHMFEMLRRIREWCVLLWLFREPLVPFPASPPAPAVEGFIVGPLRGPPGKC